MPVSEVMQLTTECLQALRLGTIEDDPACHELEVPNDRTGLRILDEEDDEPEKPSDDSKHSEKAREILATLKALLDFLPMRNCPKEAFSSKGGQIVKNVIQATPKQLEQRREFGRNGYVTILNRLIDCFDAPWFDSLNKKQRKRFIDPFFLEGIPSYVLLVFCDRIKNLPQGVRLSRLLVMLEKFFTSDSYRDIFFQHAFNHHEGTEPQMLQAVCDKVLVALTAFPNIAFNKLKEQTPKYLSPKSYYTFLVLQLTLCISEIMLEKQYSQSPLPDNVPVFLGSVLGKLCFSSGGFADHVLVQLLSSNGLTCLDHQDWQTLFNQILLNVPDTCLEATILPLLRHCSHPTGVRCILGDDFLSKKTKAIFLLTNKFIFVRYFQNSTILQNIMGYLSSSTLDQPSLREKAYIETLSKLLDVWGSEHSLKHTSVDQHTYLTQAILCGMAVLEPDDIRSHGDVFLSKLLTGMSVHLSSSTLTIRELGMILAEIVVDILRTESQVQRDETFSDKLEFEHSTNEEIVQLAESLRKLGKAPELPSTKIGDKVVPCNIFPKWDSNMNSCVKNLPMKLEELSHDELVEAVKNIELSETEDPGDSTGATLAQDDELDSDDDLEPYDLSNDKPLICKAPKYIQECMEGLLSSQDDKDPQPGKMESCLRNCEALIRDAHDETMEEVGVEMAKILLHLADTFGSYDYNFEEMRLNALIACLVRAPKKVATYLTGEFYERNYSIRQRMDILEVINNGAQELANLSMALWSIKDKEKNGHAEVKGKSESDCSGQPEHWSKIVQKRIDAKTRIISKGKTKGELEALANKFGPVAGYFFFPLLKMLDTPSATLYLLDKNDLLLGRLLYTLGVVLYSAVNTPVCRNMAASLLEVVWCIRYHSQVYVRLSLIYVISIIVITLPPHVLISDFQTELLDTKEWLMEVSSQDPEPECQRQAMQTLNLLGAALAQSFK